MSAQIDELVAVIESAMADLQIQTDKMKAFFDLTAAQRAKAMLDACTDDERMEIFHQYCTHCGDNNPKCQCWNDE